jgi:hypothetical protein
VKMRRRKDTFVKSSSIADIQELVTIAQNEKEYHEEKVKLLKNRIEEVSRSIRVTREMFLSFLNSHGLDPNYPIFGDVLSDEIVPDTVPEQAMSAVPISDAMLPNIPNSTFLYTQNLLQTKYETLQDEIEEYTDSIAKMKLKKAELEARLDSVKKSIEEYQDKISDQQTLYDDSVKNLDKIRSLYSSLLDFKYLFTVLPSEFTADSYRKFQDNYFDRYSTNYHGKKKSIKKYADILQETYKPTSIDMMEEGFYMTVFRDISIYFGPFEEDNLPDKYVDAMPKKTDILKKLEGFSTDLNKLILNVKTSVDTIRGVKGVGNSIVDGLIASTNEIANSFATQKRIEHTTLEEISNTNYTVKLSFAQEVQGIKDKLSKGVDKLDEQFLKSSGKFLRKIALTVGYPVSYVYDRKTTLENHIREKVRRKYGGNIPFCDEVVATNAFGDKVFIKSSEYDAKTGKSVAVASSDALEKKTRTSGDITRSV